MKAGKSQSLKQLAQFLANQNFENETALIEERYERHEAEYDQTMAEADRNYRIALAEIERLS